VGGRRYREVSGEIEMELGIGIEGVTSHPQSWPKFSP
jgi:hypothetical protein